MLIRTTCRNQCRDQRQTTLRKGFNVPLVGDPKASHTVNKANPRILCGSAQLLLGLEKKL